jgi:hypothetical protein
VLGPQAVGRLIDAYLASQRAFGVPTGDMIRRLAIVTTNCARASPIHRGRV